MKHLKNWPISVVINDIPVAQRFRTWLLEKFCSKVIKFYSDRDAFWKKVVQACEKKNSVNLKTGLKGFEDKSAVNGPDLEDNLQLMEEQFVKNNLQLMEEKFVKKAQEDYANETWDFKFRHCPICKSRRPTSSEKYSKKPFLSVRKGGIIQVRR